MRRLPAALPVSSVGTLILALAAFTPAVGCGQEAMDNRTTRVVRSWVQQSLAGDFGGADTLLAFPVTFHDVSGTTVLSRVEFIDRLVSQRRQRGEPHLAQLEVFGERDKAFVIYSAESSGGGESAVRAYRVAEGRIAEEWRGPTAEGLRWSWEPAEDGDPESNRRVLARWYEEIYPTGDWQSVPQVVGAAFLRHEDREFTMVPEEYAQRLRGLFDLTGPLRFDYEVVSAGDKVAVIAHGSRGRGYLQVWRVREGRLVESWWVPGGTAW